MVPATEGPLATEDKEPNIVIEYLYVFANNDRPNRCFVFLEGSDQTMDAIE
jgi:hypothetical protein